MIKLFILYAILIFAKRAPKLISELLKLKGDGVGLKGLSIKNKMGEAALVGDRVKNRMLYAEGRLKGAAGGASGGFIHTKGGLKARLKGAKKGGITGGRREVGRNAVSKGDTKGIAKDSYGNVRGIARGGRPTLWERARGGYDDFAYRNFPKGYTETEQSNVAQFNELKKRLVDMYGTKEANKIIADLRANGELNFASNQEFEKGKKKIKAYSSAYNSSKLPAGVDINSIDKRYIKQNILDERKKTYDKIAGYDAQIERTMKSVDPTAQQIYSKQVGLNAERSALQKELSSYDTQISNLKQQLILNSGNTQKTAQINNDISNLQNQKLTCQQQIDRYTAQIDAYQQELNRNQSYANAQAIVSSIEQKRNTVFTDAVKDGLFAKDGNSGLDLAVPEVRHTTTDKNGNQVASLSALYAELPEETKKNEKALSQVTKEIEESGKKATPPKSDN